MKFSQYDLVVYNNQGGVTVFNTRNNNYVKINEEADIEKFKHFFEDKVPLSTDDDMVKSLYERGYIVDNDIDEYKEMKKEIDELMKESSKRLSLTIYVTEQCNFRCIYCPEEHVSKKLSKTKWEALNKYILNSVKEGKYTSIGISFFGGEPLLESKSITEFLINLKDGLKDYPNVHCSHSVVTNGYLLSPDLYDKLVSLDVKLFQITVDGFKETHEKMRPMANGNSSWDKIIKNMEYINSKDDDVLIDYRANFNDMNIHTMKEYKKWIHEKFNNPKFRFKFHPVVGFSTGVKKELVAKIDTDEKTDIIENVNDYTDERNFDFGHHCLEKFSYICRVAYPSYYALYTDGRISKCENITIPYDYLFVGYLSDEGDFVFNSDMSIWTDNYEIEGCKECGMYPVCCARTCPTKKFGYPDERPDCMAHDEKSLDGIVEFVKKL